MRWVAIDRATGDLVVLQVRETDDTTDPRGLGRGVSARGPLVGNTMEETKAAVAKVFGWEWAEHRHTYEQREVMGETIEAAMVVGTKVPS